MSIITIILANRYSRPQSSWVQQQRTNQIYGTDTIGQGTAIASTCCIHSPSNLPATTRPEWSGFAQHSDFIPHCMLRISIYYIPMSLGLNSIPPLFPKSHSQSSKRRRHFEHLESGSRRCKLSLKMSEQPSLKREGTMAVTAQVKTTLAYIKHTWNK